MCFCLEASLTGAQSKQWGNFAGCATNSVAVGNYWGREEGFFCLYELNWINWVALREQISGLTCSIFYFSATMATAPYNYSYIFKYIIIGKYQWALGPACSVWTHEKLWLLSARACATSAPSGHHTSLQLQHLLEHFASLISKVLEFMLKTQVLIGKPLHEAHEPLSGCGFVFKCCF